MKEGKGISAEAPTKTSTVTLWLRVENNSNFIRGKKHAREDIERYHLQQYGMKRLSDCEYGLTFSYKDDTYLDQQVYDLLQDIDNQADLHHCFIEANVRESGTDRSW